MNMCMRLHMCLHMPHACAAAGRMRQPPSSVEEDTLSAWAQQPRSSIAAENGNIIIIVKSIVKRQDNLMDPILIQHNRVRCKSLLNEQYAA